MRPITGHVRDGQMSALKGRIVGEKVEDGKWSASNLVTGAQYDIDVTGSRTLYDLRTGRLVTIGHINVTKSLGDTKEIGDFTVVKVGNRYVALDFDRDGFQPIYEAQ